MKRAVCDSAVATPEQIRAFHLTGTGLDELVPGKNGFVLRPEILAGLQNPPPPVSGSSLRELYLHALREQRGKARERFLEQVHYRRDRLRELLALDDRRDPAISGLPRTILEAIGLAGSFFDGGALASSLEGGSNPVQRMSSLRRRRCEAALEILSTAFQEAATQPELHEFPAADSGAIAFCEQQLERHAATLRALHVARLEMECAYEESVHDEMLARFTWESADAESLAAMPAVLVLDSVENLAEKSLTVFGRLLRSGLPLQILVNCPAFYTGDAAFLAVSHREAFVLQSSLAAPEHLMHGLMDMAHTLRPAVAVVATGDSELFHRSRIFPLYVYNPEAGDDWVDRFQLDTETSAEAGLNAVHVAATYPHMQAHFRILPEDCRDSELVELCDYLAQYKDRVPLAVPFIWVLDNEGRRSRAATTREMVRIARDRQRAWRLLSELADAGRPAPPPVDTAKIRQESATEALLRVVSMLTANGVSPQLPSIDLPVAAVASTSIAAIAEAIADPYIESALCTSCNDCMKINSRMFEYNGEKQAFIADPSAGTFAELVKAAQNCPGGCIHPGNPRPDDRTATPQLIARAAKFNV